MSCIPIAALFNTLIALFFFFFPPPCFVSVVRATNIALEFRDEKTVSIAMPVLENLHKPTHSTDKVVFDGASGFLVHVCSQY